MVVLMPRFCLSRCHSFCGVYRVRRKDGEDDPLGHIKPRMEAAAHALRITAVADETGFLQSLAPDGRCAP
jgi:hypothetical protein